MTQLKIPSDIFDQMVAQAKALAPIEACGILAGKDGKVEKCYEMTNVDNSSVHFMMEPKEQFAVVKDIRASALGMLAVYHSHPATGPRPSDEDIRLAFTPDVNYVIVSLQNPDEPEAKVYKISGKTINEIELEIVEGVEWTP